MIILTISSVRLIMQTVRREVFVLLMVWFMLTNNGNDNVLCKKRNPDIFIENDRPYFIFFIFLPNPFFFIACLKIKSAKCK